MKEHIKVFELARLVDEQTCLKRSQISLLQKRCVTAEACIHFSAGSNAAQSCFILFVFCFSNIFAFVY